jgi:hypothetical protein
LKRLNTLLSIAVAAMMITGAFMVLAPVAVAKSTTVVDPEPLDLGYKIREQGFDADLLSQNGHTQDEAVPGDYWVVGDHAKYYLGSYGSAYYLGTPRTSYMWFTMRLAEGNCEIWTQDDASFPAGDPRNEFTSRLSITDEQVQYMADQFNDNIYPVETSYFAAAPPLDGSGGYFEQNGWPESRLFRTHDTGRVMIMVFNIVDDNFWDPAYPYYIVGYFSPTVDGYYARNIIHIDIWDWTNRTGGNTPDHRRDYLYESTVAHEYQHLLHNYMKPDDPTWINEGFSDYTEMLTGYGSPDSHIAHYLFNPDNALTAWGDQGDINILADYGAAALFMIYVNDHFGGPQFFSDFMHNPISGIPGITSTLAQEGYWQWTYNSVFKAFRMANLIRADTPGNGLYNYVSVDLDAIQALTVHEFPLGLGEVSRSEFLGPTYTMEGFDTGVSTVSAYSTDYYAVSFDGMVKAANKFVFDGDDKVYYNNWYITETEVGYMWYSGTGIDLADQKLVATLYVTEGMTFEFDTAYYLEDYWDYGFVQVSTNKGTSWTSLEFPGTTYEYDPNAISTAIDNLPGITGSSDGLVHVTLDLSAYAGQEILLSFRYVTDWGTTYDGWWVGNFVLNGEPMSLDYFTPQYENVDFLVTMYFPATDLLPARITDVPVFRVDETGIRYLAWFSGYSEGFVIISPNNGPVDYQFGIVPIYGPR